MALDQYKQRRREAIKAGYPTGQNSTGKNSLDGFKSALYTLDHLIQQSLAKYTKAVHSIGEAFRHRDNYSYVTFTLDSLTAQRNHMWEKIKWITRFEVPRTVKPETDKFLVLCKGLGVDLKKFFEDVMKMIQGMKSEIGVKRPDARPRFRAFHDYLIKEPLQDLQNAAIIVGRLCQCFWLMSQDRTSFGCPSYQFLLTEIRKIYFYDVQWFHSVRHYGIEYHPGHNVVSTGRAKYIPSFSAVYDTFKSWGRSLEYSRWQRPTIVGQQLCDAGRRAWGRRPESQRMPDFTIGPTNRVPLLRRVSTE